MTHFLHNLADTRQMAEKAMAESREHALPVPWFREAAMTRMLIHDSGCNGKSRFYKLDLWHGFHLGIGKSWAAGGLLMIQQFLEGGNMDDRFKQMSAMYVQFCKANKIDKIISKIDKYLCGGGGSAEPLGTWNKAAVTTNLCLFMEWFFTENPDVVTHDDGVYYMVTCFQVGFMMHMCFSGVVCFFHTFMLLIFFLTNPGTWNCKNQLYISTFVQWRFMASP